MRSQRSGIGAGESLAKIAKDAKKNQRFNFPN